MLRVAASVLLVVVTALIPLALSGIGAFAARDTSTTTTSMSVVTRLTGTTARHRDVTASASRITAFNNKNSMATMDMDTAARLTGGVDLAAVSMSIVAVLLLKIRRKKIESGR